MPGIVGAQQVGNLLAAAFAQHDPIRTHTQGRLDQIRQADGTHALDVRLPGGERHMIGWRDAVEFANLLHRDDALAGVDFVQQGFHQCGFAASGAAGDQYGRAVAYQAV